MGDGVRARLAGPVHAGIGRLTDLLGGAARRHVIVLFAGVLALDSADKATVGAAATQLRGALGIGNSELGLLAAVTSVVGALATVPIGMLVDRVNRTRLLATAIALWGAAMVASAAATSFAPLLLARVFLGVVTAAAGPSIASMTGDFFPSDERGRVYGYILTGELVGAGFGFVVAGNLAALSWRGAFAVLALPAVALAWLVHRLPEPARGGASWLRPGTEEVPEEPADRPGEPAATGGPARPSRAQRAVLASGVEPDPRLVLREDPRRMSLWAAVRYVLRVRTNVVLIVASACGYFFFAGVRSFGVEFVKGQYHLGQSTASSLTLALGVGGVAGVLVGGRLGDRLQRRGRFDGRVLVAVVAVLATTALFLPALLTRSVLVALPLLVAAAFALAAQNPPMDAARLDIMPPGLWGRAEAVRSLLRTAAEALAPLLFGVVSEQAFGGGRAGLQDAFLVMLVPLAGGGLVLLRALRTYPRDVASAAASIARAAREPARVG